MSEISRRAEAVARRRILPRACCAFLVVGAVVCVLTTVGLLVQADRKARYFRLQAVLTIATAHHHEQHGTDPQWVEGLTPGQASHELLRQLLASTTFVTSTGEERRIPPALEIEAIAEFLGDSDGDVTPGVPLIDDDGRPAPGVEIIDPWGIPVPYVSEDGGYSLFSPRDR